MYRILEKASKDIDSILDYSMVNFGIEVMLEYHKSLETCFATLDENPDLGMEVDHIRSGYFCFHHRSHTIFYQKNEEGILIVRLLHQSMYASKYFN